MKLEKEKEEEEEEEEEEDKLYLDSEACRKEVRDRFLAIDGVWTTRGSATRNGRAKRTVWQRGKIGELTARRNVELFDVV
ncbi:MAG: hypothetical protein M1813_004344 [Trichoglossum hirsutum]|nr:MAG: hypothetical protein M1813_004344 [Trichoglossum hirsutum]